MRISPNLVWKLQPLLHEMLIFIIRMGPWRPFGGLLGASWGHLGASWGLLGASWGPLGAILGPSWGPCVCLFEQLRYARTSRRAIKVIVFLTCLNSTPHPRISRDCTTRKNATFQHRRAPGPLHEKLDGVIHVNCLSGGSPWDPDSPSGLSCVAKECYLIRRFAC